MAKNSTTVEKLLTAITAVASAGETDGVVGTKTYQASGLTTSGAGAATILVQGTNDGISWDTIGTIGLTLGTARVSDSLLSNDRYLKVRGNVTAISGTGAAVSLTMAY